MQTTMIPGVAAQVTCQRCGERHIPISHCPTCNYARAPRIEYRRVTHASHGIPGRVEGWDLEIWDVAQPFDAPWPTAVPRDAEKHGGAWVTTVQWTRFVKKAPMTPGTCEHCAERAAPYRF